MKISKKIYNTFYIIYSIYEYLFNLISFFLILKFIFHYFSNFFLFYYPKINNLFYHYNDFFIFTLFIITIYLFYKFVSELIKYEKIRYIFIFGLSILMIYIIYTELKEINLLFLLYIKFFIQVFHSIIRRITKNES